MSPADEMPSAASRFRAGLAVGGETVFLLEEQHRRLRAAAVNAVHVGAVVAPVLELLLNFGNDAAGRAALIRRRVRPLRERDDRYIHREQHPPIAMQARFTPYFVIKTPPNRFS